MDDQYKYEVAISFLQRDVDFAQKLYDKLQCRLPTFFYRELQQELAGTDGEVKFRTIFRTEARVTVILYRKEWGTTPWTRIEEGAIRERGFEHGYDFCLLVPLDEPASKPKWYPSCRLWLGMQWLGIEGLVSAIYTRVQETGGQTREESFADFKARREREILEAEARKTFLESGDVRTRSRQESDIVYRRIRELALESSTLAIPMETEMQQGNLNIVSDRFTLVTGQCTDSTETRIVYGLRATLYQRPDPYYESDPHRLTDERYWYTIDKKGRNGWENSSSTQFFTSDELADHLLRCMLEEIYKHRTGEATD